MVLNIPLQQPLKELSNTFMYSFWKDTRFVQISVYYSEVTLGLLKQNIAESLLLSLSSYNVSQNILRLTNEID